MASAVSERWVVVQDHESSESLRILRVVVHGEVKPHDLEAVLRAVKKTVAPRFFEVGGELIVCAYLADAQKQAEQMQGLFGTGWVGFLHAKRDFTTTRIQPELRPAGDDEDFFFTTCPRLFRQVHWKRFVGLEKQARDAAAAKYPKFGNADERLRYQASLHGGLVDAFKKHYDLKDWQLEFILNEAAAEGWTADQIADPAA